MKVKLPNQEAATEWLYLDDVMADEYPTGVNVGETADGVRHLRVKKSVGEQLVSEYEFEEMADEGTN